MAQLGGLAWSLSYGCSWVVAGSGIVWVPAAKGRPARYLSLFLWSQGLSMGASLGFLTEASEQSACSHDSSGLQDQVRQRWTLCYPFYPSLESDTVLPPDWLQLSQNSTHFKWDHADFTS